MVCAVFSLNWQLLVTVAEHVLPKVVPVAGHAAAASLAIVTE